MNSSNYAEIPSPNTASRPRFHSRTNLKMIIGGVVVALLIVGATFRSKAVSTSTTSVKTTADLMKALQSAQTRMATTGSVPVNSLARQQPASFYSHAAGVPFQAAGAQFQRPVTRFQAPPVTAHQGLPMTAHQAPPMTAHQASSLLASRERLLSSAVKFPVHDVSHLQQHQAMSAAMPPVSARQLSSIVKSRLSSNTSKFPTSAQQKLAMSAPISRFATPRTYPMHYVNHMSPYVPQAANTIKSQIPSANKALLDSLTKAKQAYFNSNPVHMASHSVLGRSAAAGTANHLLPPTRK